MPQSLGYGKKLPARLCGCSQSISLEMPFLILGSERGFCLHRTSVTFILNQQFIIG